MPLAIIRRLFDRHARQGGEALHILLPASAYDHAMIAPESRDKVSVDNWQDEEGEEGVWWHAQQLLFTFV